LSVSPCTSAPVVADGRARPSRYSSVKADFRRRRWRLRLLPALRPRVSATVWVRRWNRFFALTEGAWFGCMGILAMEVSLSMGQVRGSTSGDGHRRRPSTQYAGRGPRQRELGHGYRQLTA